MSGVVRSSRPFVNPSRSAGVRRINLGNHVAQHLRSSFFARDDDIQLYDLIAQSPRAVLTEEKRSVCCISLPRVLNGVYPISD
jgi:hypothetical protein